jgi:hypothetical protein
MTKLTFNKIHRNNKKIIRCEKPKKDSINDIDYVKIELKKYIDYIHYDKTKDELEYEFNNFKYPNLIHIKNINSPKINLHPNMIFRICAYKDSIPSNANNEDSQYNFDDFDDYDDYETFIKSTQDKKVWYSEYNEEEDIYNNYDYDYEYVTYEDYNRIDYNTDTESDSEYNSDLTDTEDMTDYDST